MRRKTKVAIMGTVAGTTLLIGLPFALPAVAGESGWDTESGNPCPPGMVPSGSGMPTGPGMPSGMPTGSGVPSWPGMPSGMPTGSGVPSWPGMPSATSSETEHKAKSSNKTKGWWFFRHGRRG
ncbi:MAG: hypothetical protein JXA67_01630, partial [Micromonosporaceae bacterium]|nr:hypothetical protein [Micromonosporaceae bacterium]